MENDHSAGRAHVPTISLSFLFSSHRFSSAKPLYALSLSPPPSLSLSLASALPTLTSSPWPTHIDPPLLRAPLQHMLLPAPRCNPGGAEQRTHGAASLAATDMS